MDTTSSGSIIKLHHITFLVSHSLVLRRVIEPKSATLCFHFLITIFDQTPQSRRRRARRIKTENPKVI